MTQMKTNLHTTTCKVPEVHLTIEKNRQKRIENQLYYLKDQQEFELEFFNPLPYNVSAEITINGETMDKNLLIKPGQRIYLERYLDNNRKLMFSTYIVNENDENVKPAIEKNGDISIKFYRLQKTLPPLNNLPGLYTNGGPIYITYPTYPTYPNWSNPYPTIPTIYYSTTGDTLQATYCSTNNAHLNTPQENTEHYTSITSKVPEKNIETGRVEPGGYSRQELIDTEINGFTDNFYTLNFKLLPDSRKAIVDLTNSKRTCPNCKKKIKSDKFRFCPTCGEKL